MADRSLVDRKLDASLTLAERLRAGGAPLLAAYWEWREGDGQWVLFMVPESPASERKLSSAAADLLIQDPYRSIFSLSELTVDAHQAKRARAIGSYIRAASSMGRQVDTLFTGGEYFDSVVPVYFAPSLNRVSVGS
jgi:hypothetical protein